MSKKREKLHLFPFDIPIPPQHRGGHGFTYCSNGPIEASMMHVESATEAMPLKISYNGDGCVTATNLHYTNP